MREPSLTLLVAVLLSPLAALNAADTQTALTKNALPEPWTKEWSSPSRALRPLQMVHGRDLRDVKTVDYFRDDCGLGGLVINVGGAGYIRNDENWKIFVQGARNVAGEGLRFWIYDEDGYPSLEGGGTVLEGHPELVSKEMVYDPDSNPPCYVRECYEFTHSCNNFSSWQKYPDPLSPKAVGRFIDLTYRRYKTELGDDLYRKAEAFFTDEPSMMAVNIGPLPGVKVRIVDPPDPKKKNLPMVTYTDDLKERYRQKYGEELMPNVLSLFAGDSEKDKLLRGKYWALLAELDATRYYGALAAFCAADPAGPKSSGHTLREEYLEAHVPIDGNKLLVMKHMQIPGLDMLTSDPMACQNDSWMAAAFPCSAATLIDERRVMSEVSDFSQKREGDKRAATLEMMDATAAWEAAWGVTDFNLYYGIKGDANSPYRNEQTHKNYCEFVGRLNAVLRDAVPVRSLLLYYPIETLQREYIPTAGPVSVDTQSKILRETVRSFDAVGQSLCRSQIPFTLIDSQSIVELGRDRLSKFSGIVFPKHSLPSPGAVKALADAGIKVLRADGGEREAGTPHATASQPGPLSHGGSAPPSLPRPLDSPAAVRQAAGPISGPRMKTENPSEALFSGTFSRDGRMIFLLCNLGREGYAGRFRPVNLGAIPGGEWAVMDPQTGNIVMLAPQKDETGIFFDLKFKGYESSILVAPGKPALLERYIE